MTVARVLDQLQLRLLQRLGLGNGRVLQLTVEFRDQQRRSWVIDGPERGERAARPGLHRDSGEPEGRTVIV